MWENQEGLKGLVSQLDDLKDSLVYRWGVLEHERNKKVDAEIRWLPSLYPSGTGTPILVNGYPVFRFSYQGALPPYEKDNAYKTRIRDYYLRATLDAYDWNKVDIQFEKAGLLIIHYFKSKMIRDLDNRNRKYLQDALRATGLINDDSWRDLSCLEMGFHDDYDHVQMYVVDDAHFPDFHKYMKDHHFKVMTYPEVTQDEYIKAIEKEEKRQHEKELRKQKLELGRLEREDRIGKEADIQMLEEAGYKFDVDKANFLGPTDEDVERGKQWLASMNEKE